MLVVRRSGSGVGADSGVWKYFEKLDNKQAQCDICKQSYSYASTTSNLKKHLRLKHKSIYALMKSERDGNQITDVPSGSVFSPKNKGTAPALIESTVAAQSRVTTSNERPRPKSKQTQMFSSSYVIHRSEQPEKKAIDRALLDLFIKDFQPFSVVEDEGFRAFVCALNPDYELPNRKHISSAIIPSMFSNMKAMVMEEIKNHGHRICVTTDCWTSRQMNSYLAVTAHYLKVCSDKLEMKSALLDCKHLTGSHTADALTHALIDIVNEWGLENKVTFAVSDNTANIKQTLDNMGWRHIGCYIYNLNLIVEKSLATYEFLIEKIKKIVAHFYGSSSATNNLLKYQTDIQKNKSPLMLKKCVPKRWNSVFYMVRRMCQLQEPLEAVMPRLKLDVSITGEEWVAMQELSNILQPFEEVTTKMSTEKYMPSSMAIVLTGGLKSICEVIIGDVTCVTSKQVIEGLIKSLEERFDDLEFTKELAIATFLDPRFKKLGFHSNIATKHVENQIMVMTEAQINTNSIAEPSNNVPKTFSLSQPPSKYSVWAKIDEKTGTQEEAGSAQIKAQSELSLYIREKNLERYGDIYQWWFNHKYIYPNLYEIFIKNAHIVATSVACEKVFSKAGYIISERRSRLGTKRATQLVFLNANHNMS